jgi:hypothetical protein
LTHNHLFTRPADIRATREPQSAAFGTDGLVMMQVLRRVIPALSIRYRIMLIAALSVLGFGGVAFTYWNGETAEDATYEGHRAYSSLREAAHRFQAQAGTLQVIERDFVVKRAADTVKHFEEQHKRATVILIDIRNMPARTSSRRSSTDSIPW